MTIELPHQVQSVRVYRLSADSQNCRDFLITFALGQEPHDFSFPPRYLRGFFATYLWPFTQISIHDYLGRFCGKEGLVRQQCLHCRYKVAACIGLQDVSSRPREDCLSDY